MTSQSAVFLFVLILAAGCSGPEQRHIGCHQAVEKLAGSFAANLDHAPVGEERCFHAKISCDMLQRNVSRQVINDKTRARMHPH